MKLLSVIALFVFLSGCFDASDAVKTKNDLFNSVEKLNLIRGDYTLGKALSQPQKKIAAENKIETNTAGTYKFQDNDLYIVADTQSDRVVIIYEYYNPAPMKKVKDLIGALAFDFGDPTLTAHDKLVYWAYGEKQKLTEDEYRKNKESKRPLDVLATVKLSCSGGIMAAAGSEGDNIAYYVISSEPILKLVQSSGL
jgi:hypothetical protein